MTTVPPLDVLALQVADEASREPGITCVVVAAWSMTPGMRRGWDVPLAATVSSRDVRGVGSCTAWAFRATLSASERSEVQRQIDALHPGAAYAWVGADVNVSRSS